MGQNKEGGGQMERGPVQIPTEKRNKVKGVTFFLCGTQQYQSVPFFKHKKTTTTTTNDVSPPLHLQPSAMHNKTLNPILPCILLPQISLSSLHQILEKLNQTCRFSRTTWYPQFSQMNNGSWRKVRKKIRVQRC